jgi:hypothetical protein
MMKTGIPKQLLFLTLLVASCHSRDVTMARQPGKEDTLKAAGAVLATAGADTTSTPESFTAFWRRFRLAVLGSDTSQLIAITEFPLETRGPDDSDTIIEMDKKKFVPFFNAYLKQWSGLDLQGSTELDGIKKTESPTKNDLGKDQVRMGDLIFERKVNGWRLIFAYLNEDTIDSLKK